jgi:hypothetical protein
LLLRCRGTDPVMAPGRVFRAGVRGAAAGTRGWDRQGSAGVSTDTPGLRRV